MSREEKTKCRERKQARERKRRTHGQEKDGVDKVLTEEQKQIKALQDQIATMNEKKTITGKPVPTEEDKLKRIYSLLGVDRAKRNAAGKALADISRYIDEGGKDTISKKNIGSTLTKGILAFDKRLDKVDQLKEAAGLMIAKGEIEKDIYKEKAVSPLSKKSVGNLASKGAHKLAHSDDFDAGEKEDAKSFQRAKGVIRATKKIAKRAQANESARDNYNPEISDKRTKEKLKKAGLPPESPKVMEAKKPIVHSTKKDSLKMIKIKYNSPIKTKVTDIGAGGKEYVRKDWSEGYIKEKFVPHDMWDENGKKHFAKTEIKHLAMKAKGWSHDNPNKTEEKKKGLDGKECWDGYKQMGTKKKGGKTVDNCVKMKEEQIQLVTNLDFNEGIVTLVNRGLSKVRDSIKSAEKTSGYKVDPSKNNTNNPVSGDNIRKRLASQKKR